MTSMDLTENFCIVSDELPTYSEKDKFYDRALFLTPLVVPFVAFFTYPWVGSAYHEIADILSGRTWYAVDGGAQQILELLPVTNGIVVPSVSVAFGTLTAITIQTLRTRQVAIRALINKEACAVRNLHTASRAVYSAPAYHHQRLQTNLLLREYCTRLIFESRFGGVDLDALERVGASDSELDGISEVMYMTYDHDNEEGDDRRRFVANTAFTAMNLVRDLQMLRSDRLALLQTPFPAVHWLILSVLAASIELAYLFETDLQVLRFLDDLQLRYLFTVLSSAFLALAALCADLENPFRGSFNIAGATSQLECIREIVRESCLEDVDGAQDGALPQSPELENSKVGS